jgi:hypothetical protein
MILILPSPVALQFLKDLGLLTYPHSFMWGFVTRKFLRGGVVTTTPTPNLEDQCNALSLAWVALPGAYAPASIALRVELASLPTRNMCFDNVVVLGEAMILKKKKKKKKNYICIYSKTLQKVCALGSCL